MKGMKKGRSQTKTIPLWAGQDGRMDGRARTHTHTHTHTHTILAGAKMGEKKDGLRIMSKEAKEIPWDA